MVPTWKMIDLNKFVPRIIYRGYMYTKSDQVFQTAKGAQNIASIDVQRIEFGYHYGDKIPGLVAEGYEMEQLY